MNESDDAHVPVLAEELADAVVNDDAGVYVDCTFGRGGHARAVLARIGPRGRVLAIDRDRQAVAAGRDMARRDARLRVVHAPFSRLARVVEAERVTVSGVYFDLGVSSPQLDDAARGFSFMRDGPLDMRMDTSQPVTAAEWLASADVEEIEHIIRDYGEERYARRIARAIVRQRESKPIETTGALADIVLSAMPAGAKRGAASVHPATRTFQAVRMHINDELNELRAGLEQAVDVLSVGGRLAVISFHSLEDRQVKRFMRALANPPRPSRHRPLPPTSEAPRLALIGKPITASESEVACNPRARSARLRAAEKRA